MYGIAWDSLDTGARETLLDIWQAELPEGEV